jgi:tetratricopeptide (TPR) repeat protein
LRERLQQLPGSEALEQGHLFQQVTNFLRVLAETHPLLLILDDLQWADSASIGLLFHLGRRLEGARILLAAAYRPEEVSQNNDVARSPDPAPATTQDDQALARVLTEFKRRFGDVWLDLAEVREPEGRRFVNALLDLEPNRLQDDFRNRLYEHAGAHPLFTVELLRSMQEHGDLVQDGTGLWVPGPALDWERLPPRVEGVIEARVGRLEREMRELLSVASVEGEVFTAQVVARVQEIDERQALQRLSQQLEKRHRLVREQSAIAVCGRRQARYRFAHALFQRYLYNDLSNGERVLLHGQIAGILEDLCADCPEELAVRAPQLAHHYSESGDKERTFKYLTLAGDVAMAAYAHEEAIGYYSRALGLLPANTAQERYHLLLAREKLYNLQGAREAQARDLAALEVLADVLDDACPLADRGRRAEVALRQANYERMTGDNAAAIAAVQAAVHLAQSARDLDHEMEGRSMWGEVLDSQGEYDAAQQQLEQALTLARESGARRVEADCLRYLGWVFWHQGIRYPTVQRTSWEQALDLYREVADRQGEANALYDLGVLYLGLGDLVGARSNFEQSHRILHEIGDRHGEATPLGNLGWVFRGEDDYAGARDPVERAMAIYREVGSRQGEGADLMDLGETLAGQGYYTQSEACCNHALHIFREIRDPAREGRVLGWLGLIRYQQGEYARARAFLEDSVRICHDFGPRWVESRSLAVLSLVLHAQGDHELARSHAQQALHNGPERYHLGQGDSALALGHALAGLGDATGATAAYLQALDKYHSSGYRNPPMEALAGLARLELTGAEPWQALPLVEEILEHLRTNTLHGTYEPLRIYLTCYQALKAHDDTRTAKVLHTAHRLLREWAANIEDRGLRRSFLEEVPAHRTLVQEYEGDASGG